MWRTFLRWLAPVLIAAACWLPAGRGQDDFKGTRMDTAAAKGEGEKSERGAPALQYAVAMLCTLLILVIVCKPSRKT
jgi:hypothetical protein